MVPIRPRVEGEREDEILDATLELLIEVGYDRLTMDAVAKRSRASKATLYRRWETKASLVDRRAAARQGRPARRAPDTGTLRGDLLAAFCGPKGPAGHAGTRALGAVDHRALQRPRVRRGVPRALHRAEGRRLARDLPAGPGPRRDPGRRRPRGDRPGAGRDPAAPRLRDGPPDRRLDRRARRRPRHPPGRGLHPDPARTTQTLSRESKEPHERRRHHPGLGDDGTAVHAPGTATATSAGPSS